MAIIHETTSYRADDGVNVATYLARPEGNGPFPGLVMGYEFWGMLEMPGGGPHMRDVAGRFAKEGYVAIVPDYYAVRGKQPTMEGGTIKGGPSDEQSGCDLASAVEWLRAQSFVAADRIGVIGWCGGGRQGPVSRRTLAAHRGRCLVLRAAHQSANSAWPLTIDLVPQIHCPVFGAYGDADKAIPVETTRTLRRSTGAPWRSARNPHLRRRGARLHE